MKLQKIYGAFGRDSCKLIIEMPCHEREAVQSLCEEVDLSAQYDIKIEKRRVKRSLDANAYMWVLIGHIAEKQNLGSNEVYRHMVRDYGIYDIIPVKIENISFWIDMWSKRGTGWICEDLGECKRTMGYHNIKSYYGTSVYNTKQMSTLIDGVIYEAKELGIETLTPDELAELFREEIEDERSTVDRETN